MKKIAILAKTLGCGGTEVALISFINKLNMEDDITLYLIENDLSFRDRITRPVKIKILDFGFYSRVIQQDINPGENNHSVMSFMARIYRRMNRAKLFEAILKKVPKIEESYDLLLDFHGYGYFMTVYGIGKISARKRAMWVHDEDMSCFFKVRRYMSQYNSLFCVSKAVQAAMKKEFPEIADHTAVLYNTIDIPQILERAKEKPEIDLCEEKLIFVSVGRLERQKGFDIAIESARKLKNNQIDFNWYIVGDGSERDSLQTKINNYDLGKCMHLTGMMNNPLPLVNKCDLYVQPSRHEGYCIALLEARALHKPVISTDILCVREQIVNGVNGYIAAYEDSDDLYLKIRTCLGSNLATKLATSIEDINFDGEMNTFYNFANT